MTNDRSAPNLQQPDPQQFEKLGAFYLGRMYDLEQARLEDPLLLYDAKDLTTHAVVGMTGSGKTGLCLSLLEEAAIDGIPAIAIDPKGDLGILLLTFPELSPDDFRSWVDESVATRDGLTPDEFAAKTAQTWRDGLASWGQSPERIAKFKNAVDTAIYTPGGDAGLPLTVLRSFAAPAERSSTTPTRCASASARQRRACWLCSELTPIRFAAGNTSSFPTFWTAPGAKAATWISPP